MTRTAYLTIDDSPTPDFRAKVNFLFANKVPAVFFIIGQHAQGVFRQDLVHAIRKGFVLGNHSWTHPDFSKIPFGQAEQEIRRSHRLLEDLYAEAGEPWSMKLFRFPYLNKGGENRARIQSLLAELGYVQPSFRNLNLHPLDHEDGDLDVSITFDTIDWAISVGSGTNGVRTVEDIYARMDEHAPAAGKTLNVADSSNIVLLHDHIEIRELFQPLVAHMLRKGLKFELPAV